MYNTHQGRAESTSEEVYRGVQEQVCMSTSVQIEVEHVVAVRDESEGKSEGEGKSKDKGKVEGKKDILQVQVHE